MQVPFRRSTNFVDFSSIQKMVSLLIMLCVRVCFSYCVCLRVYASAAVSVLMVLLIYSMSHCFFAITEKC